jgi:hypothetical protein
VSGGFAGACQKRIMSRRNLALAVFLAVIVGIFIFAYAINLPPL